MDIRKHAVKPTAKLHLKGPDGKLLYSEDGKPVCIIGYGPGSKEYAAAKFADQNALIEQVRNKGDSVSAEESTLRAAKLLTSITQSFENIEYDGLQGTELFMAVYSDTSIGFIAEQFNKWAADWANFK